MGGLELRTYLLGLALITAGLAASCAAIASSVVTARADTLDWALVQAYQNNPSLNAQRAALRAADENVPRALSGYRPKLSVTASGGFNYFNQVNKVINQQVFPNQPVYTSIAEDLPTRQFGATATQTLFNGFQTANRTRQAESQVMGARETLRVTEQQVLLDAATAYMNLLRDQAILDLNRRNVEVLTEQLKQTRDRFNVGRAPTSHRRNRAWLQDVRSFFWRNRITSPRRRITAG
jgi:outer membrane protein